MQNVKRLSRKIKVKLSRKIKLSQPINLMYYSNMCFQAGLTREEIVKRRRRVSSRNARRTNFAQRQASLLLKAAIQPRITNSVVLRTARALMVRDYSTNIQFNEMGGVQRSVHATWKLSSTIRSHYIDRAKIALGMSSLETFVSGHLGTDSPNTINLTDVGETDMELEVDNLNQTLFE